MSRTRGAPCLIAIGVTWLAGIIFWSTPPSRGDQPNVVQEKKSVTLKPFYFGVHACSTGGCHDNPLNADHGPQPKLKPQEFPLSRYNEVQIWMKKDKHKDAYKVLKEARALQMAKLMKVDGDLSKDLRCISCHGVPVKDLAPELRDDSFNIQEGVSCVVCHGAHKEWVEKHASPFRKAWEGFSRAKKERDYGMLDLRDAEKHSRLCASCHIGNAEEGKVVTHAMYAAGHPPLPGIETATFSDAMPRHWEYIGEKPEPAQKILQHDPAMGNMDRTRLVVIAGLVSFRESMNLLASQAKEGAAAKDPDKPWPELAQFDCYACHHDLKSDSWRQKRGYTGKPGRPDMRSWPLALVHLGILQASKGDAAREKVLTDEMHQHMKDLSSAFSAQPFGDPQKVAGAAQRLSQWTDGLLQELHKSRVDRAAAERLVGDFGKLTRSRLVDFDSARQITWAFRTIQNELDGGKTSNPERDRLLKALDMQLKLDLPKGQVEITKDFLKETLEKINSFEPEQFKRTFDQLIPKR